MKEELWIQILQLSKDEKVELLKALEQDIGLSEEGYRMKPIELTNDQNAELLNRLTSVANLEMCTIEFDDHIIHLQRQCNDK